MTQLLGWIATFLFTICYVPQIIKTTRMKTLDGVSIVMFLVQLIANVVALWYAILISQPPLIFKYALGIIFLSIVLWACFNVRYGNSSTKSGS